MKWLCLLLAVACAPVGVSGSFAGEPFSPVQDVLAVADRHTFITVGGTTTAALRADADRTLTLLFSSQDLPREHWAFLPSHDVQRLKQSFAHQDTLLLSGIHLQNTEPGDVRTADVTLSFGLLRAEKSLGEARASITFDRIDVAPRQGFVAGRVELELEGGDADGQVVLSFSTPIARERLGKANLDFARPIVVCAASGGTDCRDAAQPTVSETSTPP